MQCDHKPRTQLRIYHKKYSRIKQLAELTTSILHPNPIPARAYRFVPRVGGLHPWRGTWRASYRVPSTRLPGSAGPGSESARGAIRASAQPPIHQTKRAKTQGNQEIGIRT